MLYISSDNYYSFMKTSIIIMDGVILDCYCTLEDPLHKPTFIKSIYSCFCVIHYRRLMLIEQRVLGEGWKSEKSAIFQYFSGPVEVKDINVVMHYRPEIKVHPCHV